MKKKKIILLLSLILFFSVFPTTQCNPYKQRYKIPKHSSLLRLIDCLSALDVISTPFIDVKKNFIFFENDLSGKLEFLPELSTSKQKVWAASTSHSVLSRNEGILLPEMKILLNNKEIKSLEESNENSVNWKFIETNRNIEIRYDEKYNRGGKFLLFKEGDSFSFNTILPSAPVELEIVALRNWHPIDLEIYFNDKFIEKKPVELSKKTLKISKKTKAGTYKITLKASISNRLKKNNKPKPPRINIYKIQIKSQNDVILFFTSSKLQSDFLNSTIKTRYFSDQDESGHENEYTHLYKMKHDFTLDKFDQNENPENIKKKIVLENLSLDVLMAPPKSQFEFKLTVSSQSYLEFGVGIFSYEDIKKPYSVMYKIIAEENNTKKIIYEKEFQLKPGNKRDQLVFEKIDLALFLKKNIKLTFLTEKPSSTYKKDSKNTVLSFWFNPIIYQPSHEKLNIILISLDTLRADHLGSYGYNRKTSPNIDDFTKDCVLFENVYAQSSWTLPSHVSLLFSLNSASHQVYYQEQKIDSSLPSLATFLRNNGFMTYAFTGGGYVSNIFGFSKGFEWYSEPVTGRHVWLRDDEAERLFYCTSRWLNKSEDKQFFLFLHTFQTHGPYRCPSPWNRTFLKETAKWKGLDLNTYLKRFGYDYSFTSNEIQNIIDLYDGEIRYTDEMLIKPLISLLKELGIYDNTLIVLTSDHGEEFYDHNGWLHGKTLYDESIRIPLIIKFPHSKFKGKRIKTKCRLIDIMPTILETASVKYRKNIIDGKSLTDLILNKERKDRAFISDLAYNDITVPCPALVATNRDDFKFIIEKSETGVKSIELYNLLKDPNEKKDIYIKNIKLSQEIRKTLDKYYRKKQQIQRKKVQVILDEKLEEKLRALGYLR